MRKDEFERRIQEYQDEIDRREGQIEDLRRDILFARAVSEAMDSLPDVLEWKAAHRRKPYKLTVMGKLVEFHWGYGPYIEGKDNIVWFAYF